jgi:pimeloyl-ACP methyl ester carboxylesterase
LNELPGSVDLPAPTRVLLMDGLAEGLAAGPGGMIDDYVMFFTAWGFDGADIRCPVTIMAADRDVVSRRHGSWLAARIPDTRYVVVPGGHIGPREAEEEALLDWLVSY